jgi:hypothetical protein
MLLAAMAAGYVAGKRKRFAIMGCDATRPGEFPERSIRSWRYIKTAQEQRSTRRSFLTGPRMNPKRHECIYN